MGKEDPQAGVITLRGRRFLPHALQVLGDGIGPRLALRAIQSVKFGAQDAPPRRLRNASRLARRGKVFRNAIIGGGRVSCCESPGQNSALKSVSYQSPNSSPIGPWWNHVRVSVAGENA
jgi:hypothetical protein